MALESESQLIIDGGIGDGTINPQRVAASRSVFERQWHTRLHQLENFKVEDRRLGDLMGRVLDWKFELPLGQVARSMVYVGSNARLRRVVQSLMMGGTEIRVGAIGGSITHGAKASQVGVTDWFSLVGTYLKRAFPLANIVTRNGAVPATPSALMNMCLESYVDSNVDLIFVEYAANDGVNRLDPIKPKVYERLLRKLLHYPHAPAVVLLQLMPKGLAYAPGSREKAPYMATLEDTYGVLGQYYDLPWLSFRNAAWRLGEFHSHGYNWTDFLWDQDMLHPIDSGMRAVADIVVNLIQHTTTGLLLHPFGAVDQELLAERQPPPMHAGNWQARNLMCDYGELFARHVDAAGSSGWEFINEGRTGAPKWGYISTKPGSVLRIQVDSRRAAGPPDAAMSIMLAYLRSYEHMGMAKFECLSGCSCKPEPQVDALHSLQQSTIYLVRLLASQHEQCVIGVTLLNDTRSQEHKFKVSGIMMNEYTGADVTTVLHEEQWLTTLQATNAASGASTAASAASTSNGVQAAPPLVAAPAAAAPTIALQAPNSD